MKKIFLFIFFFLVIELFSIQSNGRIAGRVVDKDSQQPISSVNVYLDDKIIATTDNKGKYYAYNIEIGTHTIKFERIGYQPKVRVNIIVQANQTTVINAQLVKNVIVLGKTVISGKNYFPKNTTSPVSTKSLDIDEIKTQPSGVYDVQRSIQALPAIMSGSDTENEIIVRGGNYGENEFVMDNIEMANANHFAWPGTGGGPVSIISSEFVDNVDFYAGVFPGRYGDKVSSVLDITTRDGANYFKTKLDIGMAGYGATFEGPIKKDKSAYLLSYHKSFLSLIKKSFGLTAEPHYQSIFGKETIYFEDNSKLTINQVWAYDWINIEHEDKANVPQASGYTKYDINAKSGQYTFGGTFKKIFKNSYFLMTMYNNSNWWDQKVYEINGNNDLLNFSYKFNEYLNGLKFSYFLPNLSIGNLELGLAFKMDYSQKKTYAKPDTFFIYDPFQDEPVIIDTLKDENGNIVVNKIDDDDRVTKNLLALKNAGYIQLERKIGLTTLTANLRYDYMDYNNSFVVSPRITAQTPLGDKTDINFGIGRNYQNPNYETFTSDERNKNLKPKFADQVVFGIDYLFAEDMKLTVESYYKKYKDVPISYALTTPDTLDRSAFQVNAGKGFAKGIEFFLQKKVKNNFWGTISYSFSKAQAYDPRDPTDKTLYDWDFDYENVFTGIIGKKIEFMKFDWYDRYKKYLKIFSWAVPFLSDETEISIKYRYMGGKPYTEKIYNPYLRKWFTPTNKPLNNSRFEPYQRFDILILRRWFENRFNITTYLEVENLFNTKNIWNYNYLDNGDKETVYQMGRMIVGGFLIEF